jgi:hypothetical protein
MTAQQILILAALIAVLWLSCIRFVLDPYIRVFPDEYLFLLIGREMNKGKRPYIDIIDNKPPGIYLLSQLIDRVAKSGSRSIVLARLVSLLSISTTLIFIYLMAIRWTAPTVALLAVVIYCLTILDPFWYHAFFAADNFSVLLVLASLLVASYFASVPGLFIAGFLFGLAVLMKLSTVFCSPILFLFAWLNGALDVRGFVVVLVGALATLPVAYQYLRGLPMEYVRRIFSDVPLFPSRVKMPMVNGRIALGCALRNPVIYYFGACGLLLTLAMALPGLRLDFFMTCSLWVFLVYLQSLFYVTNPQTLSLGLPPLSILSATLLDHAMAVFHLSPPPLKIMFLFTSLTLSAWNLLRLFVSYRRILKSKSKEFLDLVDFVKKMTGRDEKIYVFPAGYGVDGHLYLFTKREPATKYIHFYRSTIFNWPEIFDMLFNDLSRHCKLLVINMEHLLVLRKDLSHHGMESRLDDFLSKINKVLSSSTMIGNYKILTRAS